MSQIGRIGGQVLTDNLLRAGVDLAFETDLLYLDVTNQKIGIKDSTPSYELDINNSLRTTDLTVDTQAAIQNLRLNAPNTISTSVGGIGVFINGGGEIFHDRLATRTGSTDFLSFDGNRISSFNNSNIVFDPNGSGQVLIGADTYITGTLSISGNTVMGGDLSSAGNIIVGDQTLDTVTVNTDFTQSIVPGDDLTYALGADAADSSPRRWAELHSPDWTKVNSGAWPGSGLRPQAITISSQMTLDGVANKISTIQSNEDIKLNPLRAILTYTFDNPNAYGTSAGDRFGNEVSISGNYAIVGAFLEDDAGGTESGKAYIYDITTGSLLYTLDNPNAYSTSAGDYFGSAVAISGNYAIVGAPEEDYPSRTGVGKAYIYDVTTGSLLFTINNPTPASADNFGGAVAADGNYAVIGAWRASSGGEAYIYNVTTGTLLFTLTNPNPYSVTLGDNFGYAVAISGNYAIIGAPGEDEAGGSQSGKAYIYDVTTGTLLFTLNNPNPYSTVGSDYFGNAVAVSGNYAIISAPGEDDAGGFTSGKAYIYDVTTGTLLFTIDNPNAYGTSANDRFGGSNIFVRSVAISGDYAVVGAWQEDDAGGTESGKVYIFDVTNGELKYTIDNPNAYGTSTNDFFGRSVSISGDYIIVGATEADAGGVDSGKAYIFKIQDDIVQVESTKWDKNDIVNLLNTPLTFGSTGIGYTRIIGDNAMVVPSGTDAERRGSPEVGETRWSTDQQYLECFDGSVWAVSIGGGGGTVTVADMDDYSNIYTLILG